MPKEDIPCFKECLLNVLLAVLRLVSFHYSQNLFNDGFNQGCLFCKVNDMMLGSKAPIEP